MDSILPTNCPSCSFPLEWNKTGIDLYCYNNNCSAKNTRKILHFFQTLNNLDGFGPKTVEHLLENKYDSIQKIYSMAYEHFQDIGYKHQTIMNLGTELEESKTRPIEPYRFIAALGINHLGIGSAKKILEYYEWHQLLDLKSDQLILIDGFGSLTSFEIVEEINSRYNEIKCIFDIGFNIKKEIVEVKESSITGKTICFTGVMKNNRKKMQEYAQSLGQNQCR